MFGLVGPVADSGVGVYGVFCTRDLRRRRQYTISTIRNTRMVTLLMEMPAMAPELTVFVVEVVREELAVAVVVVDSEVEVVEAEVKI